MASKIEKFEDLIAWQKARELAKAIYRMTEDGKFSRDFGLRDQLRRSAVSVMSNISEGFERMSRAEFHQFLMIAKASCAEVRSHLYIAHDIAYIDKKQFQEMHSLAEEVGRIIGGLRASLKKPCKSDR